MDAKLKENDEDSGAFGDFIPDPKAAQALQAVEDTIQRDYTRKAVRDALEQLPTEERLAIKARYYEGQTVKASGVLYDFPYLLDLFWPVCRLILLLQSLEPFAIHCDFSPQRAELFKVKLRHANIHSLWSDSRRRRRISARSSTLAPPDAFTVWPS